MSERFDLTAEDVISGVLPKRFIGPLLSLQKWGEVTDQILPDGSRRVYFFSEREYNRLVSLLKDRSKDNIDKVYWCLVRSFESAISEDYVDKGQYLKQELDAVAAMLTGSSSQTESQRYFFAQHSNCISDLFNIGYGEIAKVYVEISGRKLLEPFHEARKPWQFLAGDIDKISIADLALGLAAYLEYLKTYVDQPAQEEPEPLTFERLFQGEKLADWAYQLAVDVGMIYENGRWTEKWRVGAIIIYWEYLEGLKPPIVAQVDKRKAVNTIAERFGETVSERTGGRVPNYRKTLRDILITKAKNFPD